MRPGVGSATAGLQPYGMDDRFVRIATRVAGRIMKLSARCVDVYAAASGGMTASKPKANQEQVQHTLARGGDNRRIRGTVGQERAGASAWCRCQSNSRCSEALTYRCSLPWRLSPTTTTIRQRRVMTIDAFTFGWSASHCAFCCRSWTTTGSPGTRPPSIWTMGARSSASPSGVTLGGAVPIVFPTTNLNT